MSHALQGHPRQKGQGGEFWQNVVHWRREWETNILALRTPWTVRKGKKIWNLRMNPPGVQYATREEERNNSRKNEKAEPKQKKHPVVDVSDGESKVWCCKEQYCTGTWDVRSMSQGRLDVVKQDMARVNIDILGISELQWTGMGKFHSDNYYIYYCGQESLRRNGALIVNKRVWNAVLGYNLKTNNDLSWYRRQTTQHTSNPGLCPNHYCWRSWRQPVLWKPTRPYRINT